MSRRLRTGARPYRVSIRFNGSDRAYPTRPVTYSTRERVFAAAREKLAEAIANRPKGWSADRYDALVFGPDDDLRTGRLIRHDGTEVDLIAAVAESSERARQYLLSIGWTDEDIERGERKR